MDVQATFIQKQELSYHMEKTNTQPIIIEKEDQRMSSGNSKVSCNISKGQITVLKSVDACKREYNKDMQEIRPRNKYLIVLK